MSRESRSTKSSESHARTKFANTQLSTMLKSHILTQNHCEYALTTLEEPPENIKLPKPATDKDTKPKPIVTTPSPVGGSKPKEESPKPVKNKAEKSLRKSARNVEKQKKEMQKKAEKTENEKPERTKVEYSGINQYRFGSGSSPVSPTAPSTPTKLQKTGNMQTPKVQNNQLLLTPPKNLRKLSKDYSPNSIEK